MGLFGNKSTATSKPVHHHAGTEGLLGAIVGHHEGSKDGGQHGARDGILAGGAIAELQHHRNKKAKREVVQHNHNYATRSRAAAGPYSTGGTAAAGGLTAGATHSSGLTSQSGSSRPTVGQGKRLQKTGKLENKVGHMLHSRSMEVKGANKVMAGQNIQVQAAEISQAERLEREAGMRRDHAVSLGAGLEHGRRHI